MEEKTTESRSPRQKMLSLIIASWWPVVGATMILSAMGAQKLRGFLPDLLCHFVVQYCIVLIPFFTLLVVAKRKVEAIAVGIVMLICLAQIAPLFIPEGRKSSANLDKLQAIKLLQMNVNTKNEKHEQVIDCVRKYEPDVVLFEEINNRWLNALTAQLPSQYKKVEALPRDDNFGIAVFAKIPKLQSQIIALGGSKVPAIQAEFATGGQLFTVFGAHVLPPYSAEYFAERNRQYEQIADLRKKSNESFILLGDLNCTVWSPYFSDLLAKTNLKDSGRGFGWQPTWPVQLPFLGIDLEHCLISENFVALKRQAGPAVGSDHLPLYLEIGWLSLAPR